MSRRTLLLTICLGLSTVSFAGHGLLAREFARLETLDQYNVFFEADPLAMIDCAVGNRLECDGRAGFAHPAFALLVNVPVRSLAWVATLGGAVGDPAVVRRELVLLVSPAAAAIQIAIVFLFGVELGLSVALAGLVALIGGLSFTQLVFGSVPDTYAAAGAFLSATWLLALRTARTGRPHLRSWALLAIATTAITVANFVTSRCCSSSRLPRVACV